ncbi:MAG: lipopolysaccharide biosynthesis protein [Rubrivivax sp.]|jgi:lipopolysaccharide biosynthesis protein|nr:MAG: lipopolysaccharide biosynthesis protein [Rubrivivax sp.]
MDRLARVIALYLPQYHPTPENDAWWGRGFTEWRNVAKAKPLYPGHQQPKLPADLGYYDLRVAETRAAQADMARAHGIEAFCYYHYWFGGREMLERPFNEVLAAGDPDFPFCLCWANESWTGVWAGQPRQTLLEQVYPGPEDHAAHFEHLLPAFRDARYLRVDGKPVFFIYRPMQIAEREQFIAQWQDLARQAGLGGFYFIGVNHRQQPWDPRTAGFDGAVAHRLPDTRPWISRRDPARWLRYKMQAWRGWPTVHRYEEVMREPVVDHVPGADVFPTVFPNWDTTARHGTRGNVIEGCDPELFAGQVRRAVDMLRDRPLDKRLLIVKSWNEWAEGNYLEPDQVTGMGYLEALRREIVRAG